MDNHERPVNSGADPGQCRVHANVAGSRTRGGLCSSHALQPGAPSSGGAVSRSGGRGGHGHRAAAPASRRPGTRPALGDRDRARGTVRRERSHPAAADRGPPAGRPRRPRPRQGDPAGRRRHAVRRDDARPALPGRGPPWRGEHPAGGARASQDRSPLDDRPRAPDTADRGPHQRWPAPGSDLRADRGAAPVAPGGDRAQRRANAAARGRHPRALALPLREREPPASAVQRHRPRRVGDRGRRAPGRAAPAADRTTRCPRPATTASTAITAGSSRRSSTSCRTRSGSPRTEAPWWSPWRSTAS